MKKANAQIAIYGGLSLTSNTKLTNGIQVRRILPNEENIFKFMNWKSNGRATCPYDWLIEFDYRYDENATDESYPGLLIKYEYIEYALRLFYKHEIGFAALVINVNNHPRNYFISSKMPSSLSVKKFDDNIEFGDFWKKYTKAYQKKPAAYEYFSQTLDYPNNIKSVLFCSTLESLFVPKEERNNKRKYVVQGITILGFSNIEVKAINDLFDFRNDYAHANKRKQPKLFLGYPWWKNCEKLIRKILFKYLEKPW
ncbi:hypothetical protein M1615_01930 [Patescibacteria group bacterium]|nr:hypothetical protein [Patescibacteria group bacterium]